MKSKSLLLISIIILVAFQNSFSQEWLVTGNAVLGNAFLGTTNGQDLNLKTENPLNINFYTNAGAGTFNNLRMIIRGNNV
jgi:hypothetical protein